jgi:hypothetical protein
LYPTALISCCNNKILAILELNKNPQIELITAEVAGSNPVPATHY